MNALPGPYGAREVVIPYLGGVAAGLLVIAFSANDPVSTLAGALLTAVHLALLARYARSRAPTAQFELQRHLSTPLALSVSLLVSARQLPMVVDWLAVFWALFAALFNHLLFRSRVLNAFLGVYVLVGLLLGPILHPRPGFEQAAVVFLALATVYVLWYQRTLLALVDESLLRSAGEARRAERRDVATGLPNRLGLIEAVDELLTMPRATATTPTLVAAVDIDSSGTLRRKLGGPGYFGRVRMAVATMRRRAEAHGIREMEVGLSGADRLLIAVEGGTQPDALLADLLSALGNAPAGLDCVAGFALHPEDGSDAPTLVESAESSLLFARSERLGRVRRMDPAERAAIEEEEALVQDLRSPLGQAGFRLVYQPQVNAAGQVLAAESLLRWTHPSHGAVSPVRFVPALEHAGLIGGVGDTVLQMAMRAAVDLRGAGLGTIRLAVNLSPIQLADPGLVDRVEALLRAHDLPGSALEVEVTEASVLHHVGRSVEVLNALRSLGITASVDDFGTGYSSLSRLLELPIDTVKVDRAFVSQIGERPAAERLVRTILLMARELGHHTVAEGVETQLQHDVLASHGCDLFQGYLYARPLEFSAFVDWCSGTPGRPHPLPPKPAP